MQVFWQLLVTLAARPVFHGLRLLEGDFLERQLELR